MLQRTLSLKDVMKIVGIRLQEVQERLSERKMSLELDGEAKNFLAASGYSPIYGARPLNRAIQSDLLNPLSVMILSDQIRDGETVRVTFDGPHNRLRITPNHQGTGKLDMDTDPDAMDFEDIDVQEMD
jgi:ATP-dependent Clp protease ATP-binding subunit ClpB